MSDAGAANPQLLEWVKEWYDTARERSSKGTTTYKHAYNSLRACPITFSHPSELQQLKGFGSKLCERLTEKLKKWCEENGRPMPKRKRRSTKTGLANQDEDAEEGRPPKRPRKAQAYVPRYRSGAYALVLGLATLAEDAEVGMTKARLIEVAQKYCDSSFTAPSDPTKFYTAWSSMTTLLDNEIVYQRRRPMVRYSLTDKGWEVAKRIREAEGVERDRSESGRVSNAPFSNGPVSSAPVSNPAVILEDSPVPEGDPPKQAIEYADVIANGPVVSGNFSPPEFTPIRLQPGSFTVHLVLDVREVRAQTDRDYMRNELAKKGVTAIMRSLELGDAVWVAKCHDPEFLGRHGAEGDEVVLDWIVERKRLDDLIGSIRDGRFNEQKFRLRRSGIKNVIYLVEEIALDPTRFEKYEEAVQSAIASTQVVSGYFLKKTQKMDDTVHYLARMTMLLKKMYEKDSVLAIPTNIITTQNYLPLLKHFREASPSISYHVSYPAFASLVSKSDVMTLRDVYLKMLMCTRGVTGEKAVEIQKRWKTPYDFVRAFDVCGSGDEGKKRKQELVFNQMGSLVGRKKIAKVLSVKIAETWGDA